MSGKAKSKYQSELIEFNKSLKNPISNILKILPYNYNLGTIETLFKEFYYFEWLKITEMKLLYDKKDKKLISYDKKTRYKPKDPINYLYSLPQVKGKLKNKEKHQFNYDDILRKKYIEKLKKIRYPKIEKIKEKRRKAIEKAQEIEPDFLEILIGFYERKIALQKDKVYIFKELEKYYCKKSINFFQKINDTEINNQLREMAFYHLQSLGHYVKLRGKRSIRIPSKNKKRREFLKKIYSEQKYNISQIPQELEYRIDNSKEQKIKRYDFFISHSSRDYSFVQNTIEKLNKNNKNVYCDWINDTDYLKRKLVGESTKKVIEKRLEQSDNLLLIKSKESMLSSWVKYELNYFIELGKPIFEIDLINGYYEIVKCNLNIEQWFYDENYRELQLF